MSAKLKIIQVLPSLSKGGAERLVLNITQKLVEFGHTVKIVILKNENLYPELSANFDVEFVEANVVHSLLGTSLIEVDDFNKLVDDFKPDVIHSHLIESELASKFRPRKDVAYITHWHGCPQLINPTPFNKWFSKDTVWEWNTKRIMKQQYKNCNNHFLCISNFIENYVQKNLDASKKDTSIIFNAIDTELFQPLGLEKKEGFRLVAIGSLNKNKNHRFLVELMAELIKKGHSNIHLDIIGGGPQRENLEKLISKLGVQDNVHLVGIVDDPEKHLNQSHVLVHCSWHEPFGLVLIEAMACGIPVLSFNTGGPLELVKNGVNGYLVQKDNKEEYLGRIIQLIENQDELAELCKTSLAFAQDYGIDSYSRKVEALYFDRIKTLAQ